MTKRIAILGAGASGMAAAKACLEEGHDVVVFERTNYTGGLWRYQPTLDHDGTATVMKSTIINTSKEMSAFTDFPPPAEYPNFMHNTKMVAYFDMYAKTFNFERYVRYRHEVLSLTQNGDFEETGRWRVKAKNLDDSSNIVDEVFDGVMVCTGHHGTVSMPTFKGQEKFKGTITHTHSLKTSAGYEDKNVVVVGIGNSGGDAAVEMSVCAKQVYLSTRTGSWVSHRVSTNGRPLDQYINRRFVQYMLDFLPFNTVCSIYEKYINSVFDHEDYNLKPRHRALSQHITINDALPNRILSGTVIVKGDIDYLTENGVVFKGETKETPCDAIICATGYKIKFPFISEELVPVIKNKVRLYKWCFVPNIKHAHTLALIGLIQPIGALIPISEMQSRWFALLMSGKLRLPSHDQMEKDIEKKVEFQKLFYQSERHTIQVFWVSFMDEIAKEIGACPNVLKYLLTDPKLAMKLIFGPCAPYQYRLEGPHKWEGAREAILTVDERVDAALATNKVFVKSKNAQTMLPRLTFFNLVAIFGVAAFACVALFLLKLIF